MFREKERLSGVGLTISLSRVLLSLRGERRRRRKTMMIYAALRRGTKPRRRRRNRRAGTETASGQSRVILMLPEIFLSPLSLVNGSGFVYLYHLLAFSLKMLSVFLNFFECAYVGIGCSYR